MPILKNIKMRLESEVELLVKRKTEFYDQRIATQEQVVINSEQKLAELEYRQECGEIYREFDHKVQKFKYLDELIKNQRSILPTQRGKLEALRAEKEREIARIRDISFTHDPANILSVTHITVN